MRLVLGAMMWLVSTCVALAEGRLALVIGNGGYSAVTPLDNPVNDARATGARLAETGFEVMLLIDAGQAEMKRAIVDFGRQLRALGPDATGLFYYAGHGVQATGRNFLLPVEAAIGHPADLDIVGVEAQWVLRQMFSARNKTNIVILDACRDNPFGGIDGMAEQGLAEMQAPPGTFISYATAPGGVAADGMGENSPFTASFLTAMKEPGVSIEDVFRSVRIDVRAATGGLQTPWDSSSLTTEFFFVPPVVVTPEEMAAQQLWNSVRESRDPVQIVLYLRAHPESPFAEEARALLATAIEAEIGAAPVAEAPVAEAPVAGAAVAGAAVAGAAVAGAAEPAPVEAERPRARPTGQSAEVALAEPLATAPSADESALLERARQSGRPEDYAAYLEAFPNGTFADLARAEQSALAAAAPVAPPDPTPDPTLAPRSEPGVVRFDQPLAYGAEWVAGQTLAALIEGMPRHAPIEGLPAEVWADRRCSGCHEWTRTALCDQGNVYLGETAQRSLAKLHPYGGSFKENLRAWAAGGCQ